jgi:hypothetical protein
MSLALGAGAVASLVIGWARPAPWALALLLVALLSVLWFFAVSRVLRADAWGGTRHALTGRGPRLDVMCVLDRDDRQEQRDKSRR